ncbi:MAG TPA: hypothetical protein VF189_04490 [Patescibacteria group bacterium]
MDPKQTAQLDPKLKEAYDRVMGTPTTQQVPTIPNAPTVPSPQVSPSPQDPTMPSMTQTPAPSLSPSMPASNPPLPVAPVVMPHSTETIKIGGGNPQPVASPQGMVAKPTKKGISPVILILGAVVFLVAYTLFWVKFLNVPIPFINQ